MNREQEEEWTSVRCIYDGSDDVVLRPNDADAPEAEVQASVRMHPNVWVRLSIQLLDSKSVFACVLVFFASLKNLMRLPEQYLNGEDSAVPIFWSPGMHSSCLLRNRRWQSSFTRKTGHCTTPALRLVSACHGAESCRCIKMTHTHTQRQRSEKLRCSSCNKVLHVKQCMCVLWWGCQTVP